MSHPVSFPVTTQVVGKEYEGTYYVTSKMVHVESEYGGNTTQLGNLPAATLASMMLADIIRGAIARGEVPSEGRA